MWVQPVRYMKKILIFSTLFCACFFTQLSAAKVKSIEQMKQEKKVEPKKKDYRIINSNRLFVEKQGVDEFITHLKGDVHFFYGDTEFYCDEARIFEKNQRVELSGNVKIIEDSTTLQTENLTYSKNEGILNLIKNVFIRQEQYDGTIKTFASQEAQYFRQDKKIIARNNVRLYDERKDVVAFSDYLEYELEKAYGYMIKSPEVLSFSNDSLRITGEKIEYFDDYKKVVVNYNVKTYTTNHRTESDFLIYFRDESKIILTGNPKFYSQQADATAKKFYIYLKNGDVDSVVFEDSVKSFFSNDKDGEKVNVLTADLMNFNFVDGKLDMFSANENVDIVLRNSDEKEFSLNNTTGDKMIVFLDDNTKVETMYMKNRVKGKYYFSKRKSGEESD